MSSGLKVGLVLSGGGAKGAYQVGVVKALVEMGVQVDAIAGASIGALNGAVLAASPSLEEGVRRLAEVWRELAAESPLQPNWPSYLNLLQSVGLTYSSPLLGMIFQSATTALPALIGPAGITLRTVMQTVSLLIRAQRSRQSSGGGVVSSRPLEILMDKYLDPSALTNGVPLYVSAYSTRRLSQDLGGILRAELGLEENRGSEFFHVQSLDLATRKNALMASAAIPMLFEPQVIDGKSYTDGGQGGWSNAQGNTPIQPLLDAGCRQILVTHLGNGSLWSRDRFPDATVLEIRPQRSIARAEGLMGGAKDLLGFSASSIESWIEQGYEDTLVCVKRVRDSVVAHRALQESTSALRVSENRGEASERFMRDAMARLRTGDFDAQGGA